MALYKVVCSKCGHRDTTLAENPTVALATPCEKCGGSVSRTATGPGAQKVETLDNGLMARALERPADAERLYKERHDSADPLAGMSLKPSND
jgi:PHP family Zn ribbon phosphoesterase